MVNYETKTSTFFFNLQFLATEQVDFFATTVWYGGIGGSNGINLDSSGLVQQPLGMDYNLFNESIAGYSDLDVTRFSQVVGGNVRLADGWILNAVGGYDDYGDNDPYLFLTEGRRFYAQFGAAWIF